mgnify:CR=1 FL=1
MNGIKLTHGCAALVLLAVLSIPLPGFASGDTGHGPSLKQQVFYLINFLAFAWLIYVLAWDSLKKGFLGRREKIKASIDEGQTALNTAKAGEENAKQSLEMLAEEQKSIVESYRQDGVRLVEQIEERNRNDIEKLRETTLASINAEQERANRKLLATANRLLLDKTVEKLKTSVGQNEQDSLLDKFVTELSAGEKEMNSAK